jgi:hypothetical protein
MAHGANLSTEQRTRIPDTIFAGNDVPRSAQHGDYGRDVIAVKRVSAKRGLSIKLKRSPSRGDHR